MFVFEVRVLKTPEALKSETISELRLIKTNNLIGQIQPWSHMPRLVIRGSQPVAMLPFIP